MSSQPSDKSENTKYSKFWPLLYLLGFLLYIRDLRAVFTDFGVFPRGVDSFYNIRRIAYLVDHNFHSPAIDYYANFPIGSPVHLPFGFAMINAVFVKLFTLGQADEWWIVALSSLLTPLVAALIPCITYFTGVNLGREKMGLWASVIIILVPSEYYFLGTIDHHVFETFNLALYLFFYVKAHNSLEVSLPKANRFAFGAGASVALGILFTNALPVLIPIHCAILFIQLLKGWKNLTYRFHLLLIQLFFFAAMIFLLFPFVVTHIADPGEINPSLGLCWLVAFLLYLMVLGLVWFFKGKDKNLPTLPIKLIAICFGFSAIALFSLDWSRIVNFLVFSFLGFVLKADPIVAMTKEDKPLWIVSLTGIIANYSGFVLIWPLALVLMIKRAWTQSTNLLIIAVIAMATIVLALLHIRFMTLFIVPYSLTIGFFLEELYSFISVENKTAIETNKAKLAVKQLAFAAFLLLMLYPFFVLIDYASGIVLQSDTRFLTLYPSLTWLEKNTPKTSLTGNEKTDYGVVASWDYGNWVMFFSKRPVVGAPLGHMKAAREGTRVNSSIFIQSPEESVKLIQERRVRYIVITPQNLEYTWQAAQPLDFNTKRLENFNINTDNTLFTQLLEGAIPNGRPVLRHFRLVHESSPEFKYPGLEDKPYVMIFEYVPGVEVIGKSKPNSFVRVYARLKTKYDRKITYADSTQTDAQGNFTIVLPYGFGHQKYSETELISPYKIQTEEKLINLSVSEEDVLTGKKEEIKE